MAVLSLLFSHLDESFYVRQIVRLTGAGMGAEQRELRRFTESGVLRREVRGSQVYYQAAPTCPIYEEIRSLIVKTAGVADVIRAALTRLTNRIDLAFLYGSIAQGRETKNSDADILVIGDITFGELVEALDPAQDRIGREINPTGISITCEKHPSPEHLIYVLDKSSISRVFYFKHHLLAPNETYRKTVKRFLASPYRRNGG